MKIASIVRRIKTTVADGTPAAIPSFTLSPWCAFGETTLPVGKEVVIDVELLAEEVERPLEDVEPGDVVGTDAEVELDGELIVWILLFDDRNGLSIYEASE